MKFQFRPQLLEEVKSYAASNPIVTDEILNCSMGVNPYGYAPSVEAAIKAVDLSLLQDYPHSHAVQDGLCEYWSGAASLKRGNFFFCNGSVSGLYCLNNIFSQTECCDVVGFIPTFTDMIESVRKFGMNYIAVPFDAETGCFDTDRLISAITERTALIYIDRPNNPTGSTMPLADVKKILDAAVSAGCYVIVDEAYGDFISREESAISFLNDYDCLIILKTFSKGFGLANLRCGYIIASEFIVRMLEKTSNPYIYSDIRAAACAESLRHPEYPAAHAAEFAAVKAQLRSVIGTKLKMLQTDDRVPICTLYCREGGDLMDMLFKEGVLVVPGNEFEPLDSSYIRLRVPTADMAPRLVEAVKRVEEA